MKIQHYLIFCILTACAAGAFAQEPAAQKSEKKEPIGYTDTPMLPGGKWHVHDPARPHPPVVTPATAPQQPTPPPSDAIVLFGGKDLSQWQTATGAQAAWTLGEGYFEVAPKAGNIQTRRKFGDMQLHIEFATPTPPKSNSQGRGNSGVFLMSRYEIQVLDCFNNPTYADGQCGAIYGQVPPLANATRPPGQWQTYDIIFHAPRFAADGKLVKAATVTILQNGVLVQDGAEIMGATHHRTFPKYTPHEAKEPIMLQAHGNAVRFRNIWVREL